MAITISADDPRTIRALEIAAEADQWLRWRTTDGQQAYGVPSQTHLDQYYVVTDSSCDCPDFRRNAATPPAHADAEDHEDPRACKHILAVRLYMELVRAEASRPRPVARRRRPAVGAAEPGREARRHGLSLVPDAAASGLAPASVRNAFLDLIETGRTGAAACALAAQLMHSTVVLPSQQCATLDLPTGSTFGQAAHRLSVRLGCPS